MLSPAANCSTLFQDHAFLDRFAQAAAAGFELVECWWPFASADPDPADINAFVDALASAGVRPACLNLFAGDLPGGERGVLNNPGRVAEFRAGVRVAAELSRRTGCGVFNALYGIVVDGSAADSAACAVDNLSYAASVLHAVNARVVIEPLCRNPRFGLNTPEAALALIGELRMRGAAPMGLLADLYQLAVADIDLPAFLASHCADIWHVQIADAPGRGAPGTGELPLADWLAALTRAGYSGALGLEYLDDGNADPFGWLPGRPRRVGPNRTSNKERPDRVGKEEL